MTSDHSSDKSDDSDNKGSDDDDAAAAADDDDDDGGGGGGGDDDDALAASSDSLCQHVRTSSKAIPEDVFDLFTFWMPKMWEYYKPCLLNGIIHVSYLLSPDPLLQLLL